MAYIEPAPLVDKENPFEAMMSRFRTASQILGLEEEVYNVLKVPARQVIVSLPVFTPRFLVLQKAAFGSIHMLIWMR